MGELYTTQLQAGHSLIEETKTLLHIWEDGMKSKDLYESALNQGVLPNFSADRLKRIVVKCFTPRFLKEKNVASNLKKLIHSLTPKEQSFLIFLYTARSNAILYDFIIDVYWKKYLSNQDYISISDGIEFIRTGLAKNKTPQNWSESTIKQLANSLINSLVDFDFLSVDEGNKKKISPPWLTTNLIIYIAYDLHLKGLGDNNIINNNDWKLFGMDDSDVRTHFNKISRSGFWIVQSAGSALKISWKYNSWKELIDVIIKS